MTNQEEILDMKNNEWMATLERVEELRTLLIKIQSGDILFWINGEWHYRSNEYNFPKGFITPHFILNSESLGNIDEKNVENVILNILRLLNLYNTYVIFHYDSGISFEDYLRKEENSDISTILHDRAHNSLCHSYSFYVHNDKIAFNYISSWNENGKGIHIVFNNSKYGFTYFYDLTMFLLEESWGIADYGTYTQFCKEMRKFQRHYYKTTSNTEGVLFTSFTEVELLNPENRVKRFDSKVGSYMVNTAVRIADIIDYFNLDIKVTDEKLMEKYIDTHYLYTQFGYYEFFNNITVPEVEAIVMDTIEDIFPEPFSVRKHKCTYINSYNFKINNGTNQMECLAEWHYLEECYRFRRGENAYTYFQSYDLLIHHILRAFRNEKSINWEQLIEECVHLIKAIEKSSTVDTSLEYLINDIKDPKGLEHILYNDFPF
ncbi:hypothetical protein F9U64_01725 [Gracilibacillus oryzae]|uniref:Uncharacterized protein n=1 Tax=Gracilibacillus oryzae TaxID=1672701 RepID=A0A7C8L662_9BACI|nr:hypothetical protein [Gracilibacillus oryzae]KAB8139136.1 hypothetical protein F9U64_01725 [Gracilibacillus oryzae]